MTRTKYQDIMQELDFALTFITEIAGRDATQAAEHIKQAAKMLEATRTKKADAA